MATNQYRNGTCLGIDVSENMVDLTLERVVGLENTSVMKLDFLDFWPEVERPDFIFSMEVFYYLPEIQMGIDHAFEVLEPGGTLMVLVNHYKEHLESREWPDQLDTHMQLWSGPEYHEGMRSAGFTDVMQSLFHVPGDPQKRLKNPGTLGTWGKKTT